MSLQTYRDRPDHRFAASLARRVGALVVMAALLCGARDADAGVYFVDPSRPGASDSGPGTRELPFRTIQGAVTAFATAGNTIVVRPGIYRETVALSRPGTPAAPIVIKAEPGAIVTGTDDFSSPALWSPLADGSYLAASVIWQPFQVFIDGARLAPGPAVPAPLPPQSFRWTAGEGLTVNLGDNPGSHACEVGRRASAVFISGPHVIVEGLEICRTDDRAVLINGSNAIIRDCTIRLANKYGIDVTSAPDVTLLRNTVSDNNDHGIIVKRESARCYIANNESFRNARPGVRAANGVDVDGSSDCVVENNNFHHNQDSGLQFVNGANNGLSRNNVSWSNGDHGFDHVRATGIRHFNDVAYGNFRDGFSFEGLASGCSMFNSIAQNNGTTSGEFNLWVDDASSAGFQSDYNIFWNDNARKPIKFRGFQFANLADYVSSSGMDGHSRAADARFMNPVLGDFRLRAGSPAIDAASADSASCPALDAAARERFDDPATPNAGVGAIDHGDLGASEYRNLAPVAMLAATTWQGLAPQTIQFDASGSADPDGPAGSFTLDFGDGASVTAQSGAQFGHTYGPGNFTVTLVVTDGFGASDTTRAPLAIAANLCSNSGFETDLRGWEAYSLATISRITAGRSGTASVKVRASAAQTFGLADHPNFVSNVVSAGTTYRYSAWVRSANSTGTIRLQLREYLSGMLQGSGTVSPIVRLSPTWQRLVAELTAVRAGSAIEFEIKSLASAGGEEFEVDDVAIIEVTDATADRAPIISAPVAVAASSGGRVTVNITAADPDGDSIAWLAADLSHLPAGSDAKFTASATRTGGTLTWTPTAADARTSGYLVMFTAANAMSGSSGTTIFVSGADAGNLCGNAGFETSFSGWEPYGPATIARVAGGHSGDFCAEVRATGATTIGLGDLPNWVTVPGTGLVFRYSAWVRSATSIGNAKLVIREFMSGTQVGAIVYSTAVKLSPAWQMISAEIRPQRAGSVIELEIKDYPAAAGETFQIDDVAIVRVGASASGTDRLSRADATSDPLLRFSAAVSPNPLRDLGALDLVLTRRGPVDIQIFDLEGRSVATPSSARVMEPGRHRIALALARLKPGAYFYLVRADEGVLKGKVLILN